MLQQFQDCASVYSHYTRRKLMLDSHFSARRSMMNSRIEEIVYFCNRYQHDHMYSHSIVSDVMDIKRLAEKALVDEYDQCIEHLSSERESVLRSVHSVDDMENYDYDGFIKFLFIVCLALGFFYAAVYGTFYGVASVYVCICFVCRFYCVYVFCL